MTKNHLLNIVSKYYLIEENIYLLEILKSCFFKEDFFRKVKNISNNLIIESRKNLKLDNVNNILNEYNLSTKEGIQLMCLAESLLRVPDFLTSNSFIKDKISFQEWNYYYKSDYWKIIFYNMVIDFVSKFYYNNSIKDKNKFYCLVKKIIVFFSNYVMKEIGKRFVYCDNAFNAINKSLGDESIYSFDMLGEAALTFYDARKFFNHYYSALIQIKKVYNGSCSKKIIPTISIKLSALHPKFNFYNRIKVFRDLMPMLNILVENAINSSTQITIDAEECDRMELTLIIFNKIFYSKMCKNWNNFGVVIQAYSKRALPTIYWLNEISIEKNKKIPVRLVKGAYWDYEIKLIQNLNLHLYPVYITKFCTDLSYLLCTIFLLSEKNKKIYSQFATHNIYNIAFVLVLFKKKNFEFQKLYGMGNKVYYYLKNYYNILCREYAPIGSYKELLPYLVRRLLENGANSSFVNKLINKNEKIRKLIKNYLINYNFNKYNKKIPLSFDLFGGKRSCVFFYNLNISFHHYKFMKKIFFYTKKIWISNSFNNFKKKNVYTKEPSNNYSIIGITKHDLYIKYSINILKKSFFLWNKTSFYKKVFVIRNFIFLLKKNFIELIVLCSKEAGKTILDSILDIKEAIDFCKYYSNQIIIINKNSLLPNITGETNLYILEGKGIFATISPWNFPIAIFCGQTIAALLSGNVVLAKPAEATSLIAFKIFQLLYKSGLPISCCQLIIGSGSTIGNQISFCNEIYGVIFTGSNYIANTINKNLMMRKNRPIHKIIAETGGINVMIIDSTSLIEQVIIDVLESSFKSCGQRCSALRLLYINENIFFDVVKLLLSSLSNINIGYPLNMSNDIGPIINNKNLLSLKEYIKKFNNNDVYFKKKKFNVGNFLEPTVIKINGIKELKNEQFGPILHVAIYKNKQINNIIKEINFLEYGLTFGIHSRNESFYKYILNKIKVGNIYINRNTIGAIVGMQPFGGYNLSGTGPKAGGCNYLLSLINEKTITINTTAQGGNIELLNN